MKQVSWSRLTAAGLHNPVQVLDDVEKSIGALGNPLRLLAQLPVLVLNALLHRFEVIAELCRQFRRFRHNACDVDCFSLRCPVNLISVHHFQLHIILLQALLLQGLLDLHAHLLIFFGFSALPGSRFWGLHHPLEQGQVCRAEIARRFHLLVGVAALAFLSNFDRR